MKKALFVYRTARKKVYDDWKKGRGPDSLLFGANYLADKGIKVEFFDDAYHFNLYHPLFYLLEHAIIGKTGMGFKLDQALTLLAKYKSYDVIVGTGDSAGLPILFLKYLKVINKPVIFMTAGLAGAIKGKTNTWVGTLYRKILPTADVFTSYSQVEIDFFKKVMGLKKRVEYMPLATDYDYFSQKTSTKRDIICAVGTELSRDYKTFFDAVRDIPIKVEVACHPDNIKGLKIPDNVHINFNVSVNEVLKIYQRSRVSVVTCKERHRSSGQMVLLESAAAGLPIIASKIKGMTTAFAFNHKDHLLYTSPGDAKEMRLKILYLLNNREEAERLGHNAAKKVKSEYTTKNLASRLAKYINDL